jgi:hypothetical protein
MPVRMRIALILGAGALLTIAILWIKSDMETWAETTIMTMDEPEERYVTVRPGDTIWAIARREYGGAETGRWVWEICQMNPGLDPGRLQPGQKVRVP